jgi:hypothetical protein
MQKIDNTIQEKIIKGLKVKIDLKRPWYYPIVRTLTLPFRIIAWPIRYILMSIIAPITRSHIIDFFRRADNKVDPKINQATLKRIQEELKVNELKFNYTEIKYKTQGLSNDCKLVHAFNRKDRETAIASRKLVINFGANGQSMSESIDALEKRHASLDGLQAFNKSLSEIDKLITRMPCKGEMRTQKNPSHPDRLAMKEQLKIIKDNMQGYITSDKMAKYDQAFSSLKALIDDNITHDTSKQQLFDEILKMHQHRKNAEQNDVMFVGYPKGATSSQEIVDACVAAIKRAMAAGYKPENISITGWSLGGAISAQVLKEMKPYLDEGQKFAGYVNDRSFTNLGDVITTPDGVMNRLLNGLAGTLGLQLDAKQAITSGLPVKQIKLSYDEEDDIINSQASLALYIEKNSDHIKIPTQVKVTEEFGHFGAGPNLYAPAKSHNEWESYKQSNEKYSKRTYHK